MMSECRHGAVIILFSVGSMLLTGCSSTSTAQPQGDVAAGDGAVAGDNTVAGDGDTQPLPLIRGRIESAGPIRDCNSVVQWNAPDGVLLRPSFSVCGDDMDQLAATLVANLDAVQAKSQKALVVIGQGVNLPASWLSACQTYTLSDGPFTGDLCLPWDTTYQANLRDALVNTIGPAITNHPALAGVYFTISTMTNGSEFHFRVDQATFPEYTLEKFRGAYEDVMDSFQDAFTVPIVFEAGHCVWKDNIDCDAPLDLYRYTRDTYGKAKVGIALWNCAERFWAGTTGAGADTYGVKPLIEEASADGVSIGCQTVGSFTNGACRFSSTEVGNYGDATGVLRDNCTKTDPDFDPESACVDTLNWFAGTSVNNDTSVLIQGTWTELWSVDVNPNGIHDTSSSCQAAAQQLAP